jgi:chitinase
LLNIIGITWDNDQWVSYDDADTFTEKRAFANSRCLGGLMVWALDQTDQTKSNGFSAAGTVTSSQQAIANQGSADAKLLVTLAHVPQAAESGITKCLR